MQKIAVFPGSFDPFTKGHANVVSRGLKMFDKIVIIIGHNSSKNNRTFDVFKMIDAIKSCYVNENVEVLTYQELTASVALRHQAHFILRGLRNTTDFEYENSIYNVNVKLAKDLNFPLETVFLITDPSSAYISSSIVREVYKYKGDVTEFLPYDLKMIE